MRYEVVIETAESNFSAYVPDLPGCVATGNTVEEVATRIEDAVALHVDGLLSDGLRIPEPTNQLSSQRKLGPKHPRRRRYVGSLPLQG